MKKTTYILAGLICLIFLRVDSRGETVLTVEDVRARSLQFNRTYLASIEDVARADAEITRRRAGAFPTVDITSSYNRNLELPSFFVNVEDEPDPIEFKTGFKNSFGAALNVRQSLWHGGKVFTAISIARIYKKYADSRAERVAAEIEYNADLLFYSAILEKTRLDVLQAAFETNSYNLEMVEKLFSQGLVSEYEVLRARVEKSNLQPQILQAESSARLAEKRLKSFLGIDLDEPVVLVEVETEPALPTMLSSEAMRDSALTNRPDMKMAEYNAEMNKKAIQVARGDYFPSLDAISNYSWQSQSDQMTLTDNQVKSWSVGLALTIPIFHGGSRSGEVRDRRAVYQQSRLALAQYRDDVKLEVEAAYDQIIQARKALDIQGETIAQGEEGLRIASLRYETGIGTQLEVLSAQTALTTARQMMATARFNYLRAKSQMKKATTIDISIGS